jgi:hypothetical protein
LTWEQQRQLIEDGHVLLVRDYLVEKGLKLPTGLEELAAAEEAAVAAAGARQGGSGSPRAPKPLRPLHPSIPQVDLDALWKRLVEPIGSEKPNLHVRTISLPAHASAKQIAAHEQTYLFDEVLGQDVHKASLLARRQKQAVDVTPGAGRTRYQKGARYSIQSDDKAGTGFWYDAVYEVLLDQNGKLLGSTGEELQLDGATRVGYARVLELRKSCGRTTHVRLSVRKQDAAACSVIVDLLQPVGRSGPSSKQFETNRTHAPPKLTSVLNLGRKVEMTPATSSSGSELRFELAKVCDGVGGRQLRSLALSPDMFTGDVMLGEVKVDLMAMTVSQLSAELAARDEPRSGRKIILRARLYAVIISLAVAEREAELEADV